MLEIKGTTMEIGKRTFVRIYGEETYRRVISLLSPEEQAAFSGPIWASKWYPLDYYVHWTEVILREVFKNDQEAQLRELVGPAIEDQFNIVYRAFLLLGPPETILKQMARITASYFRGVSVEVKTIGSGSAQLTFTGFRARDRAIEISIRGWWEKVLEASRARNVHFEVKTSIGEGKGYGEYVISWET